MCIFEQHSKEELCPCTVPALSCAETQVTGDFAGLGTVVITTFDPATQIFSGTTTGVHDNGAVLTSTIVGTLVNGVGHSVQTITGGTRQFKSTGTIGGKASQPWRFVVPSI